MPQSTSSGLCANFLACTLSLALLASCGAKSSPETATGDPVLDGQGTKNSATGESSGSEFDAVSRSGFAAALTEQACSGVAECDTVFLSDEECEEFGADLLDAARYRNAHFDAQQAATCLRASAKYGCGADDTDLLETADACNGVFFGDGAAEQQCSFNEECAQGLYCDTTTSCPGMCRAYAELGGDCSVAECPLRYTCFDHICQSSAPLGSSCGPGLLDCDSGLYCDEAPAAATCKAFYTLALGEECSPGGCAEEAYCKLVEGTRRGICVPSSAEGEVCGPYTPCLAEMHCTGGLGVDGVCTPDLARGAACEPDRFDQCSGGFCVQGACGPLAKMGAACDNDTGCSSFYCQDGLCAEQPPCP